MMRLHALAPVLLAGACALAGTIVPGVAQAADFTAPEGCTLTMTVQSRSCTVSQHYVCEAAPEHRWRAVFDANGLAYASEIDAEAQWLRDRSFPGTGWTVTELPAQDHASVTTLLETGEDDWAFDQIDPDGSRVHVTGVDRLTGESVVIDGETLQRTEFEYRMTAADGTLQYESHGREYVSARMRRFFGGVSTFSSNGREGNSPDRSPVTFDFEGDAGFGSTDPLFGCEDAILSALPTDLPVWGTRG